MAPSDAAVQDNAPSPLYNATLSLHRVSPLFLAPDIQVTNDGLAQLARRFRQVLTGTSFRGIRVAAGSNVDVDHALARAGTLKSVSWTVLGGATDGYIQSQDHPSSDLAEARGLLMRVDYERATYTATLLRATAPSTNDGLDSAFCNYPLLLLKMPVALRDTFTQFLAETFDCRVAPFYYPRGSVVEMFEKLVTHICEADDEDDDEQLTQETLADARKIRQTIKDVIVTLKFNLAESSGALKTMEIKLEREDVPEFLDRGRRQDRAHPFWTALKMYVREHLAMDLEHAAVTVLRIACGAFVVGDGRIKVIAPGTGSQESRHGERLFELLRHLASQPPPGIWSPT